MKMTATRVVLRSLLRLKDTRKTVREWERTETDPCARIAKYAAALEEDFKERFEMKDRSIHSWNVCVFSDLMVLIMEQVDWSRVAKGLLRRYAGRDPQTSRRRRWKWKR